jgi:flagellar hook protein FlgE
MLRSLYSAISGLSANQTQLDVIGNNIANVGTTAFKSQSARFEDMLSQSTADATGAGLNTGGTNPKQIGLGVQLSSIDTLNTTGNMQPTSRNLDAAIDGSGYFMVGKGAIPQDNTKGATLNSTHAVTNSNGMDISFTRDGGFTLDDKGNLLTSDGLRVLGYTMSSDGGINNSIQFSAGSDPQINYVNADSTSLKASNNLVPLVIPDSINVPAVDVPSTPATTIPLAVGTSADTLSINADGNTIAGTTPNYDKANDIKIKFATSPAAGNPSAAYDDASKTITITLSTTAANNTSANLETAVHGLTTPSGMDTNFFNRFKITGQGGWTTAAGVDAAGGNISAGVTLTLGGGAAPYTTVAGTSKIQSFSIEKDGLIKAVLDNGSVSVLGQIAVASFKNEGGLKKVGKDVYQNTANSGNPIVRSGQGDTNDNSKGFGDVDQGMLEMSNVDLAQQFTDMIVASRAFQANGKMITTDDDILNELVSLKR